jgi:chitin disaccharide deacetylase
MAERWLIVNADDFGQSHGVNQGIVDAHERGIVTSASLMVGWPAAAEAAAYARLRPALSVGLHVDLGEWIRRDGAWQPLYTAVALDDPAATSDEIARQVLRFRELLGRDPTHLDSHQHVHRREPVRSVLTALARDRGIPLREADERIRYSGAFYGQTADGDPWPDAITVAGLIRILEGLPPGLAELGCHPGFADDLDTMYREERAREVAALCDPSVRTALARLGIDLTSFAGLARTRGAP